MLVEEIVTIGFQPFFWVGSRLSDSLALLWCFPSYQRIQPVFVWLFLWNKQMRVVQSVVHIGVGGHSDSNLKHHHLLPRLPWPWFCPSAESIAEESKLRLRVE